MSSDQKFVRNLSDVGEVVGLEEMKRRKHEVIWAIGLGDDHRLLGAEILAEGDAEHVGVSGTDLVKFLAKTHALKVIFVHNHPDPKFPLPSLDDWNMTDYFGRMLDSLGKELQDHIVISDSKVGMFSMRTAQEQTPEWVSLDHFLQMFGQEEKRLETWEAHQKVRLSGQKRNDPKL